jgi:hypothetical protein
VTKREDTLIAMWIAIAGAAFVLSPFAGAAWPESIDTIIEAGRGVYAVALAACVTALALRLLRRLRKTDGT